MSNKTYIACRPGMKNAAEAAFVGIEVVVDDTLTTNWEFRERPMSLDELMEEEISKEEKVEADPKNAKTFVVPLVFQHDAVEGGCWSIPYLVVRAPDSVSSYNVVNVVKEVRPTVSGTFPDEEVHVTATIGAVKAALKKADIEVFSISEADGLTPLKEQ